MRSLRGTDPRVRASLLRVGLGVLTMVAIGAWVQIGRTAPADLAGVDLVVVALPVAAILLAVVVLLVLVGVVADAGRGTFVRAPTELFAGSRAPVGTDGRRERRTRRRFAGGARSAATVRASLEALGLEGLSGRFPEELSMGEQQRVAVARATILGPRLLVADEPTAHQDELRADLVMDRLVAVARLGGAVVVATHDERLLGRVDRVIRMLAGRVVDDRQPAESADAV